MRTKGTLLAILLSVAVGPSAALGAQNNYNFSWDAGTFSVVLDPAASYTATPYITGNGTWDYVPVGGFQVPVTVSGSGMTYGFLWIFSTPTPWWYVGGYNPSGALVGHASAYLPSSTPTGQQIVNALGAVPWSTGVSYLGSTPVENAGLPPGSEPKFNPGTGHYYQEVVYPSYVIPWLSAKAWAEASTYQGVPGHLVTITSLEENAWILDNLQDAVTGSAWLGGYAGSGGWQWVTGEAWTFSNWYPYQPSGDGPRLQCYGGQTGSRGLWNDVSDQSLTRAYIIEYDTQTDSPPTANAGLDFSVNEGQASLMLDGSGSNDPDNDPLTYAWVQLSGTPVALSDPAAPQPTFTAPSVAVGGETLTFQLTVTANGKSDTDTVDITVVNVNHPPVADAGDDQSIAEGSPVTLHGEDSFDIDNDLFTYSWVQVSGTPSVTITGADTATPTFTAPVVAAGGAPGVVTTLVFELTVNDGYPQDAPAPGYTFANVVDSVTVEVSNVNNDPTAAAGADQTVDEFTGVTLDGTGSSDPDSDPLTYVWQQTGGPAVLDLQGSTTSTPSFIVPFVSPGGADLTFTLTVHDGYGGTATDTVVVHVQNANDPPLVTAAAPTIGSLWPPTHIIVSIGITGVSDPDNNATIAITGVTQDEPTNGTGDGDTAVDAIINSDGTVFLRAERSGNGDGRVYHIHFTASDPEGSSSGVVMVTVPHTKKALVIDGGELYDSTR